MKKSVFVIVATMFLMSCGGSSNLTVATDSTAVDSTVVVDSAVAVTDSTVAQIPADSTSAK